LFLFSRGKWAERENKFGANAQCFPEKEHLGNI